LRTTANKRPIVGKCHWIILTKEEVTIDSMATISIVRNARAIEQNIDQKIITRYFLIIESFSRLLETSRRI
jgi:hypothetical protein